jgi:hypothetical protein
MYSPMINSTRRTFLRRVLAAVAALPVLGPLVARACASGDSRRPVLLYRHIRACTGIVYDDGCSRRVGYTGTIELIGPSNEHDLRQCVKIANVPIPLGWRQERHKVWMSDGRKVMYVIEHVEEPRPQPK